MDIKLAFNKITNYAVIKRLITTRSYINGVVLFNLYMTCYSLFLHFHNRLYYQGESKMDVLDLLNMGTKAYSVPFNSILKIDSPAAYVMQILSFMIIQLFFIMLYKGIFRLNKIQVNNLGEIDFVYIQTIEIKDQSGNPKTIKVTHYPYYLDFEDRIMLGSYNLKMTIAEVQSRLEGLSNIFKCELCEVSKKEIISGQLVFTISKDNFDKLQIENDNEKNYSLYVGKNNKGERVTLDIRKVFSFGIFGTAGVGKTELVKTFLKLIKKSVNNDIEIHIADSKGVDFADIVEEGAIYYDTSTLEGLNLFNDFLKTTLEEKDLTKKIMSEHRTGHAEDLREKGIVLPLKRKIIFVDESSTLLSLKSEINPEFLKIKKEIIQRFDTCLRQLRAFGVPIIISNQTMTKDSIDVGYDNLQALLINGVSQEMSRKYCEGLVSSNGTKGRWYLSCEDHHCFIKTPFKL